MQLRLGFARWLPGVRVAFQGATDNRCSERQKPQAASFPKCIIITKFTNALPISILSDFDIMIFLLSFDFFYCPFMVYQTLDTDTCWHWNMETRLLRQRVSIFRFLTIKLVFRLPSSDIFSSVFLTKLFAPCFIHVATYTQSSSPSLYWWSQSKKKLTRQFFIIHSPFQNEGMYTFFSWPSLFPVPKRK